nr:uncharacterized protein CTRU02_02332 [Colletotrichum truncatum]KAF6798359.1 hypothetical protein CTRU02_02332 [Colletotrichum truncatum]
MAKEKRASELETLDAEPIRCQDLRGFRKRSRCTSHNGSRDGRPNLDRHVGPGNWGGDIRGGECASGLPKAAITDTAEIETGMVPKSGGVS